MEHSVLTGNKNKNKNFPWCPNPDGQGGKFFHTLILHKVYMYMLITIMNGVHRQSVIANKMNLWTEYVFGWDRSTRLLCQAAAGSVGDR